MRLDINLASQPYQNMRTFWVRWITGLAVLLVITLGLLSYTASRLIDAHHQQQAIDSIQTSIAALTDRETKAKQFLNGLMALFLLTSMGGCEPQQGKKPAEGEKKLRVVTTVAPIRARIGVEVQT